MKLREALARIPPRDVTNIYSDVSFSDIRELLGLGCGWFDSDDSREKWDARTHEHFIIKWQCTDTQVGVSVILLDNEPLIVATKTARKNDTDYKFVSEEAHTKLFDFVVSLLKDEEKEPTPLCDLDEEIGEHYTVGFENDIIHSTGFVGGEAVQIIKFHRDWTGPDKMKWLAFHDARDNVTRREYIDMPIPEGLDDYVSHMVSVRYKDGTIARVNIEDLKLPFDII